MKIPQEQYDKLSDIEKIKINSWGGIMDSKGNSLIIISSIFLAFAIQNIAFFSISYSYSLLGVSMMFFSLAGLFMVTAFYLKEKTKQTIEDKYFKIELKQRRK